MPISGGQRGLTVHDAAWEPADMRSTVHACTECCVYVRVVHNPGNKSQGDAAHSRRMSRMSLRPD